MKPVSLSPEQELLLYCARPRIVKETQERIKQLCQAPLDWNTVLQLVHREHRVMPLLYNNLKAVCVESVPAVVLAQLRRSYQNNVHRNLLWTVELRQVLELFKSHGISGLPLKGPALAAGAYGDLGLRMFLDLDILVHHSDAARARELLAARGYGMIWQPKDEAAYFTTHYDYKMFHEERKVVVELHWELDKPHFAPPLRGTQVWERLEPLAIGGETVLQPSPGDLLIILCAHASKHCWSNLAWITDIAAVVHTHQEQLDWASALDRAQSLGGVRMVLIGLCLANRLLGAELPEQVLQRLERDRTARVLAQQAAKRLFQPPASKHFGAFDLFASSLFHIRMRERWREKWPYINYLRKRYLPLVFLPSDDDRAWIKLPRALEVLYFFIRPLRLFNKYVGYNTRAARKR